MRAKDPGGKQPTGSSRLIATLGTLTALLVAMGAIALYPTAKVAGAAVGAKSAPQSLLPRSSWADAIDRARSIVRTEKSEQAIPGISAAVGIDGNLVWAEGFGYADLENRVPATAHTLYRVGSVSKPITAAAVVQLALAGKLDLDAPVQHYVPSFPEKEYPITTRQVSGHIAGIRHYRGNESVGEGQRHYDDVVDALVIFRDDPLLFRPGERYSYSSYGWNLISAVVQGAAGVPFLEYMQRNIFDSLGMINTYADDPRPIIPHRARWYSEDDDDGARNASFVDNSYKWAGGGFISSVEDLVRFGSAHLGEQFIPAAGLELLFTSQRLENGEETGYGIGWRVGTLGELLERDSQPTPPEIAGLPVMHHGGSSVGGRAFLLLVPDADLVVAALVNYSRFNSGLTAARIARAFLRE